MKSVLENSEISEGLKQSSQYARSLIEASLDPLVTINANGKITDVNYASIKVTGIPRENLIGTDFSNYFTEPDKAQEGYQQVFEKGFVENYPLTIKHQNGKLTDVLYNASVYKDDKGNVLGVFAAARDITDQKLVELNLQKSLKEVSGYKYALDESSIVAITDRKGIINYANDNFCKISKYDRKELIGQDHRIINSGYHSKEFMHELWSTISKGKIWRGELKNRAKDGTLYWVDTTIVPFMDERGIIYQYVAVRINISAQKQSSQYARSLIEASLDPLVTISIDGKITDVNEASIKVTGILREKLIGTDFSNYFTEPDKAMEGYQQVFEKGFVADYPLTIKHQSGKLTDVLYNASVYKDDKGNVLGVFAAARDVTEQKLLSKYSLSLIEASLDPLITINTAGKITDMNEAKVNITGLKRQELIGSNFFDYFTEPEKARKVYQDVFEKGFIMDSPLTFRHKDGKLTDVLFNGSVYKDDRGNVLGAVVVARDITDQKRFENELIEAKSNAELATLKAEESNKLKEAFLANMSHEIRTPMNAIIGFSDILSKRNLEYQENEYVNTIKTAGENLLTIINDILDISKIEAGMMNFEEQTFSVREIFKSLSVMLMEKAKEKNLLLLFDCDENVPEVLQGDNTRLTQIIINLVGNAIKFTLKGRIIVNARIIKNGPENDNGERITLEFTVKDTGIGIPEDKLEHIFERFRQAESHTTRKYGGTGLGLSIAKQLVELQGGSLSVASKVNTGSEFTFFIPYKKSKEILHLPEITGKIYDMKELSKLNILLVEDNRLNVRLILSLFSEYNLKLEVAENGSVGINKLKENHFDIILMDMEMPVMNGYEAAVVIRRELKNNIPIIAMTAHAMAGERERCLSLGMNDYISKPINANLLFEKIYDLTVNSLIQ